MPIFYSLHVLHWGFSSFQHFVVWLTCEILQLDGTLQVEQNLTSSAYRVNNTYLKSKFRDKKD